MQRRFALTKLSKKLNTQYFGIYDLRLNRLLKGVDSLPYCIVNRTYAKYVIGVLNKSLEE